MGGSPEDAVALHWDRERVAKGLSFPITRTDFDEALADTPVSRLRIVYLSAGQSLSPKSTQRLLQHFGPNFASRTDAELELLFEVHWDGPHSGGVTPEHTAWIRFRAVVSSRRSELRGVVTRELLPAALHWLQTIEAGPETVLDGRHHAYGFVLDGDPFFVSKLQ